MIYLASQSERRRELLTKAKIRFKVVRSTYKEKPIKLDAPDLVMTHALGKAMGARLPRKGGWVLGSDTVVVYKKKILGKPRSRKEAAKMLALLSGRTHHVYTGVCFLHEKKGKGFLDFEVTKVTMKRLSKKQIEAYHKEVNPLDKAGAYGIQVGPKIVAKTTGSYSNIVGLPMELTKKILKKLVK